MILTENIKLNKRGNVDLSQKINVKCDDCGLTYESSMGNRERHIITYGMDKCRSCKQKWQYANGKREKQKEHCRKLAKLQKGKTVEELYGEQRGREFREKMSEVTSGENNPMYGKNYQTYGAIKVFQSWKGKTLEEIHGEEKATKIKIKLSNATSGENNPMYGKPSPTGSGNGWSGWYKGYYFRSLMELSYLVHLNNNDISFISAESNKYAIKYEFDGVIRNYYYDYILETGEHIEIKPKTLINTKQNKAKFKAANKILGDNFKVLNEDDFDLLNQNKIFI